MPWSLFTPKTTRAGGKPVEKHVLQNEQRLSNQREPTWSGRVRETVLALQACFDPGSGLLHGSKVHVPNTGTTKKSGPRSTRLPDRTQQNLSATRKTTTFTTLMRASERGWRAGECSHRRLGMPIARRRRRARAARDRSIDGAATEQEKTSMHGGRSVSSLSATAPAAAAPRTFDTSEFGDHARACA